MLQLILRWVAGAISLYAAVYIAKLLGFDVGLSSDVASVLITVAVLALVNAFVRPIVQLLAAPLNCLTLGLANVAINALMFLLVAWFKVGLTFASKSNGGNFVAALATSLIASVLFSVLETVVSMFGNKRSE